MNLHFPWRKKLPIIMQAEASECGIACLSMICQYFGKYTSLRELRLAMPSGQQGCSLQDLMGLANDLALSSRPLKLALSELKHLKLPAVLHWEFSHFVVLKKVNKRSIIIHDPALGERKIGMQGVSEAFTGIALELEPSQDFESMPPNKALNLWQFIKPIIGLKRQLGLLFGISILIQGLALISPFYMQTVIDKVLLSSAHSLLLILALGFALVMCIEVLCTYLRETLILRFSHQFNLHISDGVFAHLLNLPTSYFQARHMGDLVSRFGSLQAIRDFLTQGVVSAIIDGLLSLITLAVLFLYSWKLALIVLAFVVIYSLMRWFLFYPVKRLNNEILHSDAKEQSFFMQSMRAIRTIKLANTQQSTRSTWLNYFVDNSNLRIKLGQWNIVFSTANKLLFSIENIVIIYVMATLVMANQFTIGMLFAFVSYKGRFIGACASLIEKFIEYKILNVHLARLEDIVLEHGEIPPSPALSIAHKQGTLAHTASEKETALVMDTKALAYRYEGSADYLFEEVYLQASKGDCIAVVGQSGCGKSTLLHCLLGLLPATKGKISINQQIMTPQNRHRLNFAAVMQDDELLNGSVLDNISQFSEHTDIEKVITSAQIACIHNDIMAMGMQYQSLIGDMGSALSGGQKQRILLARAIYQSPQLLILDEATSHLDLQTEAQVCANLRELNTTIIMVAHRPQSIALANKVYTLSSLGLTEISYSNDNFQPKQPRG